MKRWFSPGVGSATVVVIATALALGCGSRRSGVGDEGGHPGATGGAGGAPIGGAGMGGISGGSGGAGPGSGGKGVGGATPSSSGADAAKTVGSLAVPDRKKLCDWDANLRGGYGKTTTCDNGLTTSSDASQAACVDNWPTDCTSTVLDFEACVRMLAADPCDVAALFSTECQKVPEACL